MESFGEDGFRSPNGADFRPGTKRETIKLIYQVDSYYYPEDFVYLDKLSGASDPGNGPPPSRPQRGRRHEEQ